MSRRDDRGVTAGARKKLLSLLQWSGDRDFQVEPLRGPTEGSGDGRWIIRVRLGAAPPPGQRARFEVIVREDAKGYFFLDTGERGKAGRPYCNTRDVNQAIAQAEHYLDGRRSGAGSDKSVIGAVVESRDGATFGDLLAFFPSMRASKVKSAGRYDRAARLGVILFGHDKPIKKITQAALNTAIAKRMEGIPAHRLPPVTDVTAEGILKDLVTLVRQVNELHEGDERLVPECFLTGSEVKWPRVEKKPREAAKTSAFELLMLPFEYESTDGGVIVLNPPVDVIDPTGQLRLFLAFAFYVGRRFNAIRNLRWEDIKVDLWDVRKVLERAELSRRDWATHFPHGVIDFKREFDKEENYFVPPICDGLDREIELYARRCRRQTGPLFANPKGNAPIDESFFRAAPHRKRVKDKSRYLGDYVRVGRYEAAVMLAANYLFAAGRDPGEILQVEPLRAEDDPFELLKLDAKRFRFRLIPQHKFHRWRSNFATRMEIAGWGDARDSRGNEGAGLSGYPSFIASWTPHDSSTRSSRYVNLSPRLLWLCANGVPEWEARPQVSKTEVEQARRMETRMEAYAERLTDEVTE